MYATYIHKTTDNFLSHKDQVIELTSTDNKNVFSISPEDYDRLWSNNTLFAGQYVYVTYKVGNQTYTQRYKESGNHLRQS